MEQGTALWSGFSRSADLDVVGVGENSLDHVCVVDDWPSPGSKHALRQYD